MSWRSSGSPALATDRLVVDASVVVRVCLSESQFEAFEGRSLLAPPLLWSEVPSSIHKALWRKAIPRRLADLAMEKFLEADIVPSGPSGLIREAWDVAEKLGWAKTYDAEYVALAINLDLPLVTIDRRLRRGAARVVETIEPTEL